MRQLVELEENYPVFQALNAEIVAIAQLEKDPAMLPRITEFVHNEFPIVADPGQITREPFDIFGVYLIDKDGIVQTYLPGTKEARARLDVILTELAKIEGVDAPSFQDEDAHIKVEFGEATRKQPTPILAPQDVIGVRWMWSHNMIRPKDRFKLAFVIDIAKGYHVYGDNEERLTPFKIEFELPEGVEFEKPYAYPAAKTKMDPVLKTELSVFENVIAMPKMYLKAADGLKKGRRTVKAKIHFQACNESTCLVPSVLELEMPLTVVGPKERRGQVAGSRAW